MALELQTEHHPSRNKPNGHCNSPFQCSLSESFDNSFLEDGHVTMEVLRLLPFYLEHPEFNASRTSIVPGGSLPYSFSPRTSINEGIVQLLPLDNPVSDSSRWSATEVNVDEGDGATMAHGMWYICSSETDAECFTKVYRLLLYARWGKRTSAVVFLTEVSGCRGHLIILPPIQKTTPLNWPFSVRMCLIAHMQTITLSLPN